MAARRICGLSKDVTLSVLPRLHFDELLVELRRREIDARGILVRVLKGVMVLEYQEQEEYLAEGETSSKTSSIGDQQSTGPDDFAMDDGDPSHSDRRLSLCTSSPEQGYVSMEMDTSPKPEMTQSNSESDFVGYSDAYSLDDTDLKAQETSPMDGKQTLPGKRSTERRSRSEMTQGEDGSDCYGIVISSTTSSVPGLPQQGFSADTATVGGMPEFYTAPNSHALEQTRYRDPSTKHPNAKEQASRRFSGEAREGGKRSFSSPNACLSADRRVHETTRPSENGTVSSKEPANILRVTKSEESRGDCMDGSSKETYGYLDNGLSLVNRQNDAGQNDAACSRESETEHGGHGPSNNTEMTQTAGGSRCSSRENGDVRTNDDIAARHNDATMNDRCYHGDAAHDRARNGAFQEQATNGTTHYYTAGSVATTMTTQGERPATANGAITERYGNQGNIGHSSHANAVLHRTGSEEVQTNATLPLNRTDDQHSGSYDDGNYDNGVLNLTTRNPFENVRIKVEPVDEFSEEFGQVNMQHLSGQAEGRYQATASLSANQGPDCTNSSMTSQAGEGTTVLNQDKTLDKLWKCPHCGYTTVHGGAVGSHLRTHATAECPHVCSYCTFKTVTAEYLSRHVYSVHILKQVRCPFCRFVSRSTTAVENHMVNYHWELTVLDDTSTPGIRGEGGTSPLPRPSPKRLHCSHCAFTASRQLEMNMHMFLHDKPFVHVCRFCGYRTAERPNYVRHLRIHAGFRPHKCPYCPYSASMKHHLNDHIRTHTGEKPFSCRICDYKAAFRSNLAQHMKKVHKVVDKFRCQQCSYTTICQQRLTAHIKQHNKKDEMKRKSKQQKTNDSDAPTSETDTNDVMAPEVDACADETAPSSEITQYPENQISTER
ncbi:REST [Branchiostoma lanceolatum]|uniref:REST protein n=1 Tax=Branchiostoma lanceolatum TaxID=7740 RepID=A0A8J9ZAH5_BRALA|nr:REST [Branchiostoma lanceolatum]